MAGFHDIYRPIVHVLQKFHTFATAYLQGRVKIPIGGKVREPEGTSRWNYGTDSDPAELRPMSVAAYQGSPPGLRQQQDSGDSLPG